MTPPALRRARMVASRSSSFSSALAETTTRRRVVCFQTLDLARRKGRRRRRPLAGKRSYIHQTSTRPLSTWDLSSGKSMEDPTTRTVLPRTWASSRTAQKPSWSQVSGASSSSWGQPRTTVFGRKTWPRPLARRRKRWPSTTDVATITSPKPSTPRSLRVCWSLFFASSARAASIKVNVGDDDTKTPFTRASPRPFFISWAIRFIVPACGT
mmetsp:Transcript_28277/g.91171  ORF Transcript_28277/g.91171 Transcript_28277/m.91171 type:complete len:211 (+) Transcript_28277:169-801(+)